MAERIISEQETTLSEEVLEKITNSFKAVTGLTDEEFGFLTNEISDQLWLSLLQFPTERPQQGGEEPIREVLRTLSNQQNSERLSPEQKILNFGIRKKLYNFAKKRYPNAV